LTIDHSPLTIKVPNVQVSDTRGDAMKNLSSPHKISHTHTNVDNLSLRVLQK